MFLKGTQETFSWTDLTHAIIAHIQDTGIRDPGQHESLLWENLFTEFPVGPTTHVVRLNTFIILVIFYIRGRASLLYGLGLKKGHARIMADQDVGQLEEVSKYRRSVNDHLRITWNFGSGFYRKLVLSVPLYSYTQWHVAVGCYQLSQLCVALNHAA